MLTSICRNCRKRFDVNTTRADYKGFCSQACYHALAKKYGYSPSRERRLGFTHSEHAILDRLGQLGELPIKEKARAQN